MKPASLKTCLPAALLCSLASCSMTEPETWEGIPIVETPDKIRIAHSDISHTETIGHAQDGRQFMAFVVAPSPTPPGWNFDKWYVVLHLFDGEGRYQESRHEIANDTGAAETFLERFLRELGPHEMGDVTVRPFQTTIDSCVFGLVRRGDGRLLLQPNDLLFGPPWDGWYDT